MPIDHYEQWRIDWRNRFLSMDFQALIHKLPFLRITDHHLLVPYFRQICSIRLEDGAIEPPNNWHNLTLMDEMNIYTLLWYAKPGAYLSCNWVPFEQLTHARPYGPAFRKNNLDAFASAFSGYGHLLKNTLSRFGGVPLPTGDVGCEIEVFPCIPMRILFWEGDDEFPAQANLLFDRNTTDFIHVESVVTIASCALHHFLLDAGLTV